MKQLESIGLVQYFLYNRIDLDVGRNTAFLGPNGTGKTALLDALQIVLLGADRNRIHFNASSEGKRKARSLRDYCLGVYDQRPSDVCRDSANTYINLIFRDSETDLPVTAGVSLSAHVDSPDHIFNSLYILPGVAINTEQMIEMRGNQELVLPWRQMQHNFRDRCKEAGTTPIFTINGEEFSRQLFVGQLASRGESPNHRAIRSAFARSLKLNRDVDDLDETLRIHLIEARPTNVTQFRARLDQFREIQRTIQQLGERLAEAEAVEKQYGVVRQLFVKAANYSYLKAVYLSEQLGAQTAEAKDMIEHLQSEQISARSALQSAQSAAAAAHKRLVTAQVALTQDPEYLRQLGSRTELAKGREGLDRLRTEFKQDLGRLGSALRRVVGNKDLADVQGEGASALQHLVTLSEKIGREDDIQAEDTLVVANTIGTLQKTVDSVRLDLTQQSGQAAIAVKVAKGDVARAGTGLVPLRREVAALQALLEEEGISTTPVCDLVDIKDKEWQPALEAYLRRNVDALLVHDLNQEKNAIDLYRRNRRDIYGAKLALGTRTRPWQAPGGGRFAAQLITGDDKTAVRFLQGELSKVALVDSSEQLRVGYRAISMDGMVSSGGGIDRLRLAKGSSLRIGGVSSQDQQRLALEDLRKAEEHQSEIKHRLELVAGIGQAMATAGDSEAIQVRLQLTVSQIVHQQAALSQTETLVAAGASGGGAALEDAAAAAATDYEATDKAKINANTALEKIASALFGMRERVEKLMGQQVGARDEEAAARKSPLCDLNAAEGLRQSVDGQTNDNVDEAIRACTKHLEDCLRLGNTANMKAWGLITTYLANYQMENHEIQDQNWQQAQAMIHADIKRMTELELVEKKDEADRAYIAAVEVFRSDVAHTLLNGFDAIEEQIKGLNRILDKAPEFTNGERYRFQATKVEQHKKLYNFLQRVREMGESERTLFGGSGPIPEEFRLLVEGDGKG